MAGVDNLVRYVSVSYQTRFPTGKSVMRISSGDSIKVQLPSVPRILVQGDRCQPAS